MIEIKMPRLSDTMEEGAIASWHKHPGDRVEIGDVLVEIETDKATMDYEAYEAGTMNQILVVEGTTVTIGTPIALLDNGKDVATEPAPATGAPEISVVPSVPAEVKLPVLEDVGQREVPVAVVSPALPPHAPLTRIPEPLHSGGDGVFASPLVRKLARDHDLDLSQIRGTGPGGRIIRADLGGLVEAPVVATPHAAPRVVVASGPIVEERRASQEIPVSRARRVIARRLSESAQSIPHFFVTSVADAQVLMDMRADLNSQAQSSGQSKITVNDLILRAVALALREHPDVNSSYLGDESAVMLVHNRINIGLAVASKNGLVVPVIMDTDLKSVNELSAETRSLAALANGKGLSIEQMSGGTFTISNLGMYGVEEFTAIINPPEGAILAVGATSREPVVVGEQLLARYRLRFTLSADHRIIDGALAAQFLQTLRDIIEHPWRLMGTH